MKATLSKIYKVTEGMNQLYSSMDKGFARVESNMELLKRFRTLCFEANERLGKALHGLSLHIEPILSASSDNALIPDKKLRSQICFHLNTIKETVATNIATINDYIDEFSEQWQRSFSLSVLIKFRSLLEKDLSKLDSEIDTLKMKFILEERKELLSENKKMIEADKG